MSCPPGSCASGTTACSPIARDRKNLPAPASSWPSWQQGLCCPPCQRQPLTQPPHPSLLLLALIVLAPTGAGLLVSCRNEASRHDGLLRSRSIPVCPVFPPRDLAHAANVPCVSIVWISPRLTLVRATSSCTCLLSAPCSSSPLPLLMRSPR